jgi:hypothetical protein
VCHDLLFSRSEQGLATSVDHMQGGAKRQSINQEDQLLIVRPDLPLMDRLNALAEGLERLRSPAEQSPNTGAESVHN